MGKCHSKKKREWDYEFIEAYSDTVKRISNKKNGNQMIIKSFVGTTGSYDLSYNEERILRAISHPNVPKLLDVINRDDRRHLILNFIEGITLREYVRSETRLGENIALGIILNLVKILEYVHSIGIFHRDIKPENILLSSDQVYLIDWGFADKFNNAYDPGVRGTLFYMAPELFYTYPIIGPQNDIWSLGITLFFMLTGAVPWREFLDNTKLLGEIYEMRIDYPKYFTFPCFWLLTKMLCNSNFRYSAGQISDCLTSYKFE